MDELAKDGATELRRSFINRENELMELRRWRIKRETEMNGSSAKHGGQYQSCCRRLRRAQIHLLIANNARDLAARQNEDL
jgi:hypothetical protein